MKVIVRSGTSLRSLLAVLVDSARSDIFIIRSFTHRALVTTEWLATAICICSFPLTTGYKTGGYRNLESSVGHRKWNRKAIVPDPGVRFAIWQDSLLSHRPSAQVIAGTTRCSDRHGAGLDAARDRAHENACCSLIQ
uniref:Putative secreted protein n=1 Tax=Anopheles darlingi TaxID=43151 RepID=A0A2M4DLZ8_ANODA